MAPYSRLKNEVQIENKLETTTRVSPDRVATRSSTRSPVPPPPKPRPTTGMLRPRNYHPPPSNVRTIIIEHCKQHSIFKTKANQVMRGIKSADLGVKVQINPRKPRRGCFEIREKDGATFFSLLDIKTPFQEIRDIDVERVTKRITRRLKR